MIRTRAVPASFSSHYLLRRIPLGELLLIFIAVSVAACSHDPRNVDVDLPESRPESQTTSYTQALNDLGIMTEIYATDALRIQSNPIMDNTGASASTGSEIPRDVTEMIKTSLNSIGGRVVFIPYDPAFIQNQMVTKYSSFSNKVIPNVILSGGITQFDRGLVTKGENTDANIEAEIKGIPDFLPSKNVGMRFGDEAKSGLASITLDFNLLDFETMAGVPKMNAVNTMKVHKAVAGKELSLSLIGQTFGMKGTVKKVQGRHAAVRLLVELSMIQIAGKYLALPYWRLVGQDAVPDKVVLDAVRGYYYSLSEQNVVAVAQQWLYLHGFNVPQTGQLELATKQALRSVYPQYADTEGKISPEAFEAVWITIPITQEALRRRHVLEQLLQQAQASSQQPPVAEISPAKESPPQALPEHAERTVASEKKPIAQNRVKPAEDETHSNAQLAPLNRQGIGRFLSEKEW